MKIEPWLSLNNRMGASSMPSSENRFLTQTSWQLVSDKDMYSASVEESATVFCICMFQLNIALASFTT